MRERSSTPTAAWLGVRLSVMFFIDVAVGAAYFPLLSLHLAKTLRFSPAEISAVYAVGPLTALVGPPLIGWIADRVLPAERSLALVSALRAVVLLLAARATTFGPLLTAMMLVGLVTAPAGVLSFSIAFHHLRDPESIGKIRVWGTISWILMLWVTSFYLHRFVGLEQQLAHTANIFAFAAAASLAGGLYALSLPHTPPVSTRRNVFAFVEALGLLRDKSYRTLVVAAALGSTCLQFHFMLWPLFYTDGKNGLGLDVARASELSSFAQFLEVFLFPALGLMVARWGLRRLFVLGMIAWPVRFFVYALGKPLPLVVGIQMLHGVNVVCGTVLAQVAVDRVAPRDARASSQALLVTATAGFGNLLGQVLCGRALAWFAVPGGSYAFRALFCLPLAIGVVATGLVLMAFHPARARAERERSPELRALDPE